MNISVVSKQFKEQRELTCVEIMGLKCIMASLEEEFNYESDLEHFFYCDKNVYADRPFMIMDDEGMEWWVSRGYMVPGINHDVFLVAETDDEEIYVILRVSGF